MASTLNHVPCSRWNNMYWNGYECGERAAIGGSSKRWAERELFCAYLWNARLLKTVHSVTLSVEVEQRHRPTHRQCCARAFCLLVCPRDRNSGILSVRFCVPANGCFYYYSFFFVLSTAPTRNQHDFLIYIFVICTLAGSWSHRVAVFIVDFSHIVCIRIPECLRYRIVFFVLLFSVLRFKDEDARRTKRNRRRVACPTVVRRCKQQTTKHKYSKEQGNRRYSSLPFGCWPSPPSLSPATGTTITRIIIDTRPSGETLRRYLISLVVLR